MNGNNILRSGVLKYGGASNSNGPRVLGGEGPSPFGQNRSTTLPPKGPPPSGPPPPQSGQYGMGGGNNGRGFASPVASPPLSDDARNSAFEKELFTQHAAWKRLLAQDLQKDKIPQPKRAREVLLRLSKIQFGELSIDTYDELMRRQGRIERDRDGDGPQGCPEKIPLHLLPKSTFHPKRNKARMKLSTLPPSRFADLASDIFWEMERRYPQLLNGTTESPEDVFKEIECPKIEQILFKGIPGTKGDEGATVRGDGNSKKQWRPVTPVKGMKEKQD